jgi:methyltransferase-like protein
LCRELLAPNGIAYVSYNTLPGWNSRFSLREMMLFHSRNADTTQQKITQSLEMLRMLAKGLPDNSSLSEKWLKEEVKSLLRVSPSYLLHDYLEANNTPLYFSEFMQNASEHRLQYLCEAHIYTMLSSTLTAQAAEDLDGIDDLIEYEQHLDFFYVRYFRQTLLCHEQLDLSRELDMDKLKTFYFMCNLTCEEDIDLSAQVAQIFKDPKGTTYTITQPITKAAVVDLACIYPNALSFDELKARAQSLLAQHGGEACPSDAGSLLAELFNLYLSQGLRLSLVNRKFPGEFGMKARANTLAQVYARRQKCCIASLHHSSVELDPLDLYLISLLNGDRTLEDLQQVVAIKANEDTQFMRKLGEKGIRFPVNASVLSSNIEQLLYHYARFGLLQAQP